MELSSDEVDKMSSFDGGFEVEFYNDEEELILILPLVKPVKSSFSKKKWLSDVVKIFFGVKQHWVGSIHVDVVLVAMTDTVFQLMNQFNFRLIQWFEHSFEFECNISKFFFMMMQA